MSRRLLLGLSGSLRRGSVSTAILKSLASAVSDRAELRIHPLGDLPLYNGDEDGEHAPESVAALKAAIADAEGVVVASPEYNYGISGVLKNAIDWASRPAYASVLKGKPVLIISSSPGLTGGVRAQAQARQTFAATLSRVIAHPEVVITEVYQKVVEGALVDETALAFTTAALDALLAEIALLAEAEPEAALA
ncbi:NADPH-dependent FMN reductase [Sphingobium sp. SCG-1]|uniref:NADPH-dependent FMN reductase n=1 Tax=Sphingobium sp. SCG-1 TaxID=2072936 RepID=UPI000CD6810F|nr:NADPH-dependent FMN reductase [Sphingobium sp. SCG-1]AUW60123.1 NADPH-dependent FMN reductase [Sphingobium sp. SCG-1]